LLALDLDSGEEAERAGHHREGSDHGAAEEK
jgi:hypothetical protein